MEIQIVCGRTSPRKRCKVNDDVKRFRMLKQQSGMTTKELSQRSGIPVGTLNKILASSTKSIKTETLAKLCDAMGMRLSDVVAEKQERKREEKSLGFVRVGAYTLNGKLGDLYSRAEEIVSAVADAARKGVRVVVFPELSVCGYTLGDLFYQDLLLEECEKTVVDIAKATAKFDVMFAVGCAVRRNAKVYNCAIVIFRGEILGVVPKTHLPNYNEFYEKRQFSSGKGTTGTVFFGGRERPFGTDLLFRDTYLKELVVGVEICEDLWVADSPSSSLAAAGATVILNLSASDEIVGKAQYRRELVAMQSAKAVCGYVYADACGGESSTDLVFAGHNLVTENGKVLAETELFSAKEAIAEIDVKFLSYERSKIAGYREERSDVRVLPFALYIPEDRFTRRYDKYPFVPSDERELGDRAELILSLQAEGLRRRMEHTRAKTLVVGVSGGLDSTLALLVACRAAKSAGRTLASVVAVTMPCFGTTERTKNNSVLLAEKLGVTLREIDIRESVLSHFRDIGQSEKTTDVTYENAQARERTQVLMDIANKTGGLVVGTGDLSELALGWATYNGDHMSMYGVNGSVPKTLVRYLIRHVADRSKGKLAAILKDILDTPVSPELVPADGEGKISQKTEELVGPYALHDFFLYYFVRMGFAPGKLYKIAVETFRGEYDEDAVYRWLKVFLQRFFAQQFKRSCLPDGVKVGSVSLSPRGDWRMPSDCSASTWLEDLDVAAGKAKRKRVQ